MADGTMMTGEGDTNPAQGTGQGEPSGQPAEGDQQQPQGGEPNGQPDAEPTEGQQDGAQEGESKEGEGEGESQAPETYEWKAPEGFEGELDSAAIEQFEPIAKELGLTQEQADKMVSLHAESLQRAQQQARDNWAQQQETWESELREDPDFGGPKFDENVGAAMKAVEKFGTPGLKEALESTGMGNHPELVRTFAQIGQAISEDKIVMGNQSQGERSMAERLYSQPPKK